jgi:RNA polymerase subunit RPABC4/transcription elongation factor Spt4
MHRDIRNCRRCGRIMIYVGIPICEKCLKKEEEYYDIVRRYLDEHPRSSVREIGDATGVPVEVIMKFVRQGSLVALEAAGGMLACEICGKSIEIGRVCPECAEALLSATGKLSNKILADKKTTGDKTPSRMYSMDMISRRRG